MLFLGRCISHKLNSISLSCRKEKKTYILTLNVGSPQPRNKIKLKARERQKVNNSRVRPNAKSEGKKPPPKSSVRKKTPKKSSDQSWNPPVKTS